ncbi:Uncharacterised protein [Candidatus Tiddalikarchaeum anstoanum]|nr:Uncharacterised protein [Candidatus Tiddalikarchaeum anstoanum]
MVKIMDIIKLILWAIPLIIIVPIWVSGLLQESITNSAFFITYAQILLSLFGFTFLSSVLEKDKNKPIQRDIMKSSFLFLICGVFMLIIHSYVQVQNKLPDYSLIISILLLSSIICFVYAVIFLIKTFIGWFLLKSKSKMSE